VQRDERGMIQGHVTLLNPSLSTLSVGVPPNCTFALKAYADPTYTDPPVWDQDRVWSSRPGGCKLPSAVITIPPLGEAGLTTWPESDATILGDSLAPGTYYMAVRLIILSPRHITLLVPVGAFEIGVE
jgi:hypothetical protein